MKTFYIQYNIGTAKYVVNHHNVKNLHFDGSKFYDVKIVKSSKALHNFMQSLVERGYKHQNP